MFALYFSNPTNILAARSRNLLTDLTIWIRSEHGILKKGKRKYVYYNFKMPMFLSQFFTGYYDFFHFISVIVSW